MLSSIYLKVSTSWKPTVLKTTKAKTINSWITKKTARSLNIFIIVVIIGPKVSVTIRPIAILIVAIRETRDNRN